MVGTNSPVWLFSRNSTWLSGLVISVPSRLVYAKLPLIDRVEKIEISVDPSSGISAVTPSGGVSPLWISSK